MHSTVIDISSVMISALILSCAFLILYFIELKKYLIFWSAGLALFALAQLNSLLQELGLNSYTTIFLSLFFNFFSGYSMLIGIYRFIFSEYPPKKLNIVIIFIAITCIILSINKDMLTEMFSVYLFTGIILMFSGILLLNRVKNAGAKIAGTAFFIWGIYHTFSPMVMKHIYLLSAGRHFTIFLILALSLGILTMHFSKVRSDLERMDMVFRNVTARSGDIIFQIRLNPLKAEYISPSAERILGYSIEEISQKRIYSDTPLAHFVKTVKESASCNVSGFIHHIFATTSKSGEHIDLDINSTITYGIDGKPETVLGIARDITEHATAVENLINEKDWYKDIFRYSATMLMLVDVETFMIKDCSESVLTYYCRSADEMKKTNLRDLFSIKADFERYLSSIEKQEQFNCLHCLSESHTLNVVMYTSVAKIATKQYLYITIVDNTSESYLTNELDKMRNLHESILESLTEGVVGINSEGKIFFVNNFAAGMLGYTPEELLYQDHHSMIHYKNANGPITPSECAILAALKNVSCLKRVRTALVNKNGDLIDVELNFSTLTVNRENNLGVIVFRDIREDIRRENDILNSLEDNKTLMRELHHRVKNNFQVISSLLSLQAEEIQDERYQTFVNDIVSKVHSMSLVHEMLYQTRNLTFIDAKPYLEKLLNDLQRMLCSDMNLTLVTDIDDIQMSLDSAMPCALIINELFTNAVKYALSPERENIIHFTFKQDSTGNMIQFTDNGTSSVSADELAVSPSYGINIVRSLVRQLKGTIDFNYNKGLTVTIKYK